MVLSDALVQPLQRRTVAQVLHTPDILTMRHRSHQASCQGAQFGSPCGIVATRRSAPLLRQIATMASLCRGYIEFASTFEDPQWAMSAKAVVTVMTIMTIMRHQALAKRQWLGIVGAAKATREPSVGHLLEKEPHNTDWLLRTHVQRCPMHALLHASLSLIAVWHTHENQNPRAYTRGTISCKTKTNKITTWCPMLP